jgi:hypothetical protein
MQLEIHYHAVESTVKHAGLVLDLMTEFVDIEKDGFIAEAIASTLQMHRICFTPVLTIVRVFVHAEIVNARVLQYARNKKRHVIGTESAMHAE